MPPSALRLPEAWMLIRFAPWGTGNASGFALSSPGIRKYRNTHKRAGTRGAEADVVVPVVRVVVVHVANLQVVGVVVPARTRSPVRGGGPV
jgi:hypothetical protein